MRAAALAATVVALLVLAAGATAASTKPPTAAQCAAVAAHRTHVPILALDPKPGAPRVFAMQLKQEARSVTTYAAFARKIECAIRTEVLPSLAKGRPNVVVFDEDLGLMTAAIGSRGAAARAIVARPGSVASCAGQSFPCRTLKLFAALDTGYARALSYYRKHLGKLGGESGVFVAATDTDMRGFMTTLSTLAQRYGIYIVASNDQARFVMSSDPKAIAALADPDLPRPTSVAVATSAKVYNETFLWGPAEVRKTGPAPLRNVLAVNRKVPLTGIEQALGLTAGPSGGAAAKANLRPYPLPHTKARLGLATSLPAFTYGDPPAGVDPCSNTAIYYMRCLDQLGANVVIQADANPGAWTGPDGDGIEQWQPLSWMSSTWRAVSDPSVAFAYNVTPMLVGNLGDLVFDGQSAITQRGVTTGPGCHYIGNAAIVDGEDRPDLVPDAGPQTQFLAIAPWVVPDADRASLRAVSAQLAPASGSPMENDYLETALVADLPFPVDTARPGCATG